MHVRLTSVVNLTLNLKTLSQSVCLVGLMVQHPDLVPLAAAQANTQQNVAALVFGKRVYIVLVNT